MAKPMSMSMSKARARAKDEAMSKAKVKAEILNFGGAKVITSDNYFVDMINAWADNEIRVMRDRREHANKADAWARAKAASAAIRDAVTSGNAFSVESVER